MADLVTGDDGRRRCGWCAAAPDYVRYHDEEWGRAARDDRLLFEKLCLEAFQSGLSWLTILRKREGFRRAFAGFDFHRVARFSDDKVEELLADASIVRHRGKIEAALNNARRAVEVEREVGSLAELVWRHAAESSSAPTVRSSSPVSIALAKDLKRRGFRFLGPTTIYAFLQSMGLVNDHREGCFVGDELRRASPPV